MDKDILDILKQPTAPFRENRVRWAVQKWCSANKIPTFKDNFGNLWLNAEKPDDLQEAELVLIAHMDHPGIIVHEFMLLKDKIVALGDWLGGGPTEIDNASVIVFSANESKSPITLEGKVIKHTVKDNRPQKVLIEIKEGSNKNPQAYVEELNKFAPWGACISFEELPKGCDQEKGSWYVRSADDLFLVCVLLQTIKDQKPARNIKILFSRSEEKGELGSYFAAADTPLSSKTKIVSVDLTNTDNKEDLGKGVIIREKSKEVLYNEDLVEFLESIAKQSKCDYQKVPKTF